MFDRSAFPVPDIDFSMVMPIMLVIITGIVAFIFEMLNPKRPNNAIVVTSLIGLVVAGVVTAGQFMLPEGETLAGAVLRDRFSLIVQLLLIVSCFLTILFSEGYLREKRIPFGEFYFLVLWSTAGGMLMATSRHLLVLFVGLELLSIALYVMAGMSRRENKSEESAVKYFLLGAFASGFFLYGIAFFYGASGSLHLDSLMGAWNSGGDARMLLLFGLGLILIGLGFKSAFVPFHQWTPDVYQGAPTNVTAFMAAGSKLAAIAALFRVLSSAGPMQEFWMPVLFWIAILTMSVGNLVALLQKDVKRILGYSSIAHAGYILVAVLSHVKNPQEIGIGTTVYYLLSYTLMTVGSFAVISMVARGGRESTRLSDLNGLGKRSPFAAAALVVFMCSLIGIPPLAGFFGKLFIFTDAVRAGLTPLAIVLAVNSIVSIYYYLGIAWSAFASEEAAAEREGMPINAGLAGVFGICIAGLIAASIFFAPLMNWMVGTGEASVTTTLER